jgi:Sulfotransferase family
LRPSGCTETYLRENSRQGPFLILGAGQRCGSTLLQRLLSSHPEVHIWGEHAGQLTPLLAAIARLQFWAETDGRYARLEFATDKYQSFIANLTPESIVIDEAMRRFIQVLFMESAAEIGCSIWGFKEVRYTLSQAQAIHRLFPKTQVIHIVRDPRDILRSLDVWERNYVAWDRRETHITINNWLRVAESFLYSDESGTPPVLRLRYEDVVKDPSTTCIKIAGFAGLNPDQFDKSVFTRRIHTAGPGREDDRDIRDWDHLPTSVRRLLEREDLITVANACGYDL